MYDPNTAQFLRPDPLFEAGGHANLYLYCANDPVNRTDPSGMGPPDDCPNLGIATILQKSPEFRAMLATQDMLKNFSPEKQKKLLVETFQRHYTIEVAIDRIRERAEERAKRELTEPWTQSTVAMVLGMSGGNVDAAIAKAITERKLVVHRGDISWWNKFDRDVQKPWIDSDGRIHITVAQRLNPIEAAQEIKSFLTSFRSHNGATEAFVKYLKGCRIDPDNPEAAPAIGLGLLGFAADQTKALAGIYKDIVFGFSVGALFADFAVRVPEGDIHVTDAILALAIPQVRRGLAQAGSFIVYSGKRVFRFTRSEAALIHELKQLCGGLPFTNEQIQAYRQSIGNPELALPAGYTIEDTIIFLQSGKYTCLPTVLRQYYGHLEGSDPILKELFRLAEPRGMALQTAANKLAKCDLKLNVTFTESASLDQLITRARSGQFTVVRVEGSRTGASSHAIGIHGYDAERGFYIHDPLIGFYWQTPARFWERRIQIGNNRLETGVHALFAN